MAFIYWLLSIGFYLSEKKMLESKLKEKEIAQAELYYNELRKQVELIRRHLSKEQPLRQPIIDALSQIIKQAKSAQTKLLKTE